MIPSLLDGLNKYGSGFSICEREGLAMCYARCLKKRIESYFTQPMGYVDLKGTYQVLPRGVLELLLLNLQHTGAWDDALLHLDGSFVAACQAEDTSFGDRDLRIYLTKKQGIEDKLLKLGFKKVIKDVYQFTVRDSQHPIEVSVYVGEEAQKKLHGRLFPHSPRILIPCQGALISPSNQWRVDINKTATVPFRFPVLADEFSTNTLLEMICPSDTHIEKVLEKPQVFWAVLKHFLARKQQQQQMSEEHPFKNYWFTGAAHQTLLKYTGQIDEMLARPTFFAEYSRGKRKIDKVLEYLRQQGNSYLAEKIQARIEGCKPDAFPEKQDDIVAVEG